MIALLVVTDGRLDYLSESMASAEQHLHGPITARVMIDDSGHDAHRRVLRGLHPDFVHVGDGPRRGFGATIAEAWAYLSGWGVRFVFHLEGDFTFNRDVDLGSMATLLDGHPEIVQVALRRQPWNDEERAAGGIVERHPDAYADRREGDLRWLEHRQFFTTNPSLYRRSLCEAGWPSGAQSEGMFTHRLLNDPDARFAYWGERTDEPWVEHIGYERAGVGY